MALEFRVEGLALHGRGGEGLADQFGRPEPDAPQADHAGHGQAHADERVSPPTGVREHALDVAHLLLQLVLGGGPGGQPGFGLADGFHDEQDKDGRHGAEEKEQSPTVEVAEIGASGEMNLQTNEARMFRRPKRSLEHAQGKGRGAVRGTVSAIRVAAVANARRCRSPSGAVRCRKSTRRRRKPDRPVEDRVGQHRSGEGLGSAPAVAAIRK